MTIAIEHAATELLRLGAEGEVLAPVELRVRVAGLARAMAALYAIDPSSARTYP